MAFVVDRPGVLLSSKCRWLGLCQTPWGHMSLGQMTAVALALLCLSAFPFCSKPREQMGRGMWKHLPHIYVTFGTQVGEGKVALCAWRGSRSTCLLCCPQNHAPEIELCKSLTHPHTHTGTHNTHGQARYPQLTLLNICLCNLQL